MMSVLRFEINIINQLELTLKIIKFFLLKVNVMLIKENI